ncbi:MAG: uroporphyrinogen decarboxylase [Acidiferrobacteraceae bacterium]|nr:uroporphyrinogen decarboxylase [Acidiferrobacteraceae bacterium]
MCTGTCCCVTETLRSRRLLNALRCQPVDCTPVWLMRQAGRYLPEYRAMRKKAGSFVTLCKTPELACKVTLQPLHRFDLDAAIIFSDILTIPDAMGLGLSIRENEGPRFERPIRSIDDINKLGALDPATDLAYVMNALRLTRNELNGRVPLIGFSGSPWTLATYMIENGSSADFRRSKSLLYQEPEALHKLLRLLTEAVSSYMIEQVKSGAQVLMIFDTWGGILAHADFKDFSLAPTRQIISNIKNTAEASEIPIIVFTKGGGPWITDIAATGCSAVGCDWTVSLGATRRLVGNQVALQGNMDPSILLESPEIIREQVRVVLDDYGGGAGHIFNLGHGVSPGVNPEHVAILVNSVHELSQTSN